MLNSEISFVVKSVAGSTQSFKNADGDKIKKEILKVKLVTTCISYDEVKAFKPAMYDLITQHSPIEFDTVSFKGVADNVTLKVFKSDDENKVQYEFKGVKIDKIIVKNVEDIPMYSFLLEIPLYEKSGVYFLNLNLKSVVTGIFS